MTASEDCIGTSAEMACAAETAIVVNQCDYLEDFIRLNETWISHYFRVEEADRALARNPARVIEEGGYVFTLLRKNRVVGVCALFKEGEHSYQLARMAVAPEFQGLGYGDALMQAALDKLWELRADRVYLLSNTKLTAAIALYKKHGFRILSEGQHPVYARSNVVMEKTLC